MRNREKKSGFTLVELIVVVIIMGVIASLALVGYEKTVEIQRYRTHKNNLIQLKGKLQAYYYKNRGYINGPLDLDGLNNALNTRVEDPHFSYSYNTPTPDTFNITTTHKTINYTCTIEQGYAYPQCAGDVPE